MYKHLDEDNYFEQAEAIHAFLSMNHEGQASKKYELLCRSGFNPGPMWSESSVEAENYFYADIEAMSDDELEELMDEMDEFLENEE